jgi:hypothetical protein
VLYRPEAFEPLTEEPWDVSRVAAAIRAIAADAGAAFAPDTLWPVTDEFDSATASTLTTLYAGAAGVIWSLDVLRGRGHAEPALDLPVAAARTVEIWRAAPDFPERPEAPARTHASLYFGETGPLLVGWRLTGRPDLADALYARVRENWASEANELMAGAPGTMLAARAMLAWTGEERWAEAWSESAEELWRRRYLDGFWAYPPYGKSPGAAHGIGTNAGILLQGDELFPEDRREELVRGTADALARTAVVDDGLANWPLAVEDCSNLVGWDGEIRVQWCHGGAGVVASSAPYLDEELLLAGAELVWRAGPPSMAKGPGICHGTAGNGYALLRTFGRTGDERWLERARRFAVHALGQVERWRELRGSGRYSLWTGDVGAALFASDCLDARAAVPIVDYLEP